MKRALLFLFLVTFAAAGGTVPGCGADNRKHYFSYVDAFNNVFHCETKGPASVSGTQATYVDFWTKQKITVTCTKHLIELAPQAK